MTNHGRRPAHLEYVGGKSPRQVIWEKIRELKNFEFNELVGALPGTINRDTTRTYVKSLSAAGYLLHQPNHPYEYIEYKLQKDNGVEAPRVRKDGTPVTQGREQENLWRTLRAVNYPVNYRELAGLARTEQVGISPEFARDYLVNLHKAGYVSRSDAKPFKGPCKYLLIPSMNTGPRPPMIQRIKQVYDPNLGKVMWTDQKGDDDE
jgi:hypothetical protein